MRLFFQLRGEHGLTSDDDESEDGNTKRMSSRMAHEGALPKNNCFYR